MGKKRTALRNVAANCRQSQIGLKELNGCNTLSAMATCTTYPVSSPGLSPSAHMIGVPQSRKKLESNNGGQSGASFLSPPHGAHSGKINFFNLSLLSHKRVGNGCLHSQIFLANHRPQLTFDHLFQEVFIGQHDVPRHQVVAMYNHLALSSCKFGCFTKSLRHLDFSCAVLRPKVM